MIEIDSERLDRILGLPLQSGGHQPPNGEFEACVMEAVSYIAGEPWSDHPKCACPAITSFMISWNDSLPNDEERDRLLKPLIKKVVNTAGSDALAERRGYMALDWLIRVHTPKFLELTPSLKQHATALRDLDEILDIAGATAAGDKVRAARDAAWDAAWAAARAAAGDAARATARATARDAAGDAARDAATAAARDAATAAARDAARDAARGAAWAAARAAAGDTLNPTVEWLQNSASDLVIRMCNEPEPSG